MADLKGPIKIKHLTNSLYQIETWCRTVRDVLSTMDADTVVGAEERGYTFFEKLRVVVEGLFFGWVLPPPRHGRRSKRGCDEH